MSVSRRYKPPGCRRYSPCHETATLSLFPFSVCRWSHSTRGRVRERWHRISGLNYQTGYPHRKLSVPSSPNAPETRIETAKIEIGRIRAIREISRLSIALVDSRQYNSALHLHLRCPLICTQLYIYLHPHSHPTEYNTQEVTFVQL